MIKCRFSCHTCGLRDIIVEVRAREEHEDVLQYMKGIVIQAIALKHTTLSLLCEATSIQDLKIPFPHDDPNGWVGKQTDFVPPGESNEQDYRAAP